MSDHIAARLNLPLAHQGSESAECQLGLDWDDVYPVPTYESDDVPTWAERLAGVGIPKLEIADEFLVITAPTSIGNAVRTANCFLITSTADSSDALRYDAGSRPLLIEAKDNFTSLSFARNKFQERTYGAALRRHFHGVALAAPFAIAAPPSRPDTELAERIEAARATTAFDEDSVDVAAAAASDASQFVMTHELGGEPFVSFSDDGILALQWRTDECGVALIFAGDGEVSLAFKRPGQFYAENGIDISINDELPPEFTETLAKIIQ